MSDPTQSTDIQKVVQSVVSGLSSEEENGLLLKALQTHMSATVVTQLTDLSNQFARLSQNVERAIDKYNQKLNEDLEGDVISRGELYSIIKGFQDRQFQLVETYRRVVQSPNMLFANSTVSEEEKMVMKLFQSFKSSDEKRKFLELVRKELGNE